MMQRADQPERQRDDVKRDDLVNQDRIGVGDRAIFDAFTAALDVAQVKELPRQLHRSLFAHETTTVQRLEITPELQKDDVGDVTSLGQYRQVRRGDERRKRVDVHLLSQLHA